jgi:hypothetical protein
VALGVKDVFEARRMTRRFILADGVDAAKTDANVVPSFEKTFLSHGVENESSPPSGFRDFHDEFLHVHHDEECGIVLHER